VLPGFFLDVLKWPSFFFRQIDSVLLDSLRLLDKKGLERSETNVPAVEELSHLPTAHDRQVSAKQHPIKTRKHTVNPVFISPDEFFQTPTPSDQQGPLKGMTNFEGLE